MPYFKEEYLLFGLLAQQKTVPSILIRPVSRRLLEIPQPGQAGTKQVFESLIFCLSGNSKLEIRN